MRRRCNEKHDETTTGGIVLVTITDEGEEGLVSTREEK
jgi:hypothetical protein